MTTTTSAETVKPSMVTPLSTAHRLRTLQLLHARLIRFPKQDEVLNNLLARWPELFGEGADNADGRSGCSPDKFVQAQADGADVGADCSTASMADDLAAARREIAGL